MAQWVKNLNAVAWVTGEVWVQSPAQHSGLKDLVLPQLLVTNAARIQSLAQELSRMLQVQSLGGKKKRNITFDLSKISVSFNEILFRIL